ncbi:Small heat shock protein, chloroplastic, partial [Mucuna pruriens]
METIMVRLKLNEFSSHPLPHFIVLVFSTSPKQSTPSGNIRHHWHTLNQFLCFFKQTCTMNTVAEETARLTRFSLHAPKYVEVAFANGREFKLSAEFLRINSPAVDGKIRSIGGEKVISGRRHVGIMSAEPVGNYGVRMNKLSKVKLLPLSSTRNITFCNNVKAMAEGEASLQKSKQQQQVQPKMKVPQASPKVLLNQFPVARTMQQMMDTMERMVEDPSVYGITLPWIVAGDDEYSKGKIPWAIKEGQKDYKMRFNMPGMNKNDIKVWVEENMLVVKAEKALREHHEGQANGNEELSTKHEEDWPANSYGRYSHRIALPENIELDKIKAQVIDGILYLTIPKANTSAKIIGIDVQ